MGLNVLFFEVRGTRCALPVELVREVLIAPCVTPLPLAPPPLRGIVPVHGQVLPLVDLGPTLAATTPGPGADNVGLRPSGDQIVVVETSLRAGTGEAHRVRAALVASRVQRLGTIADGHSWPPPADTPGVRATVLDADGPALLLDPAETLARLQDGLGLEARA